MMGYLSGMRKIIPMALCLASLLASAEPPVPSKCLHLVVNVPPNTPAEAPIYVTGDQPELGNWKPDAIRLYPIGPHQYQADITFPVGTTAMQLKITRGAWGKEAGGARGEPISNIDVRIPDEQTTYVRNVISWTDLPAPGVTGRVDKIAAFHSPQLGNDRDVWVWLPPGYEAEPGRRYPVVYVHDGQNVFDPRTSSFGLDWQLDEAMTSLVEHGEAPGAILVAVANTKDRDYEYDLELNGKSYARFLIDTLKPHIDRAYRTLPGRETTYTMGASLGASIAVSLAWCYPEVFSKAVGLSFPVFYRDSAMLRVVKAASRPALPIRLYFDHGDTGQDSAYEGSVRRFYDELLALGMARSDIEYRVFKYADHSEPDWARRMPIPLRFLLPGAPTRKGRCSLSLLAR